MQISYEMVSYAHVCQLTVSLWPFPYSQYGTGTSLQLTLMQEVFSTGQCRYIKILTWLRGLENKTHRG